MKDLKEEVVLSTQELLQAAIAAGNYTEVAKLAKIAANQVKLDFIKEQAAKVEQAKKDEIVNVAKVRQELIDQLTAGTFETFDSLRMIINTTVPAATKVKATKVSGTSAGTNGKTAEAVYVAIDAAGTEGISKDQIVKVTGCNENTVGELLRPVKLRTGYTVTGENGHKLYFAPAK